METSSQEFLHINGLNVYFFCKRSIRILTKLVHKVNSYRPDNEPLLGAAGNQGAFNLKYLIIGIGAASTKRGKRRPCLRSKMKLTMRSIMNQSGLEIYSCSEHQARENASGQGVFVF